ncbi:MAG: PKD domain-containing protein [Gemmatimonadales bacterium]
MLARFTRLPTLAALATLVVTSCTRELPLQPIRADIVADTGVPPPPNDNRDSARFVPFLPYFDSTDVTNATIEPGEPTSFCHDSIAQPNRTVWYVYVSHAPGTVQLTAQLLGPAPGILSAYFDSSGVGLLPVGCNSNFGPVTFNADSGMVFFFQVADSAGAAGPTVFHLQQDSTGGGGGGGNDNFADARVVPGVPYSDSADFNSATREPFEPAFCSFQQRTVWYAFTPTQTQAVSAVMQSPFFGTLTLFTGSSVNNLSFLGCTGSFSPLSFTAVAGTTYYFQLQTDVPSIATFQLLPPPPPVASFGAFPPDPSIFDLVQFQDFSFDPAGIGIQTRQWSFGDGATATGPNPTHRYTVDGDYLVELTVATFDGRTASTSQTLLVRTRDVAIMRFQTPATGFTGKTSRITVDVQSNRYPETVQVQLFKSVPGGFQLVAISNQTLPVRNRVSTVLFSYTFTPDDAIIGKVTFRAVAVILDGRDALPADNTAIGDPTKVLR